MSDKVIQAPPPTPLNLHHGGKRSGALGAQLVAAEIRVRDVRVDGKHGRHLGATRAQHRIVAQLQALDGRIAREGAGERRCTLGPQPVPRHDQRFVAVVQLVVPHGRAPERCAKRPVLAAVVGWVISATPDSSLTK